mgnify:CR=1 FL=1
MWRRILKDRVVQAHLVAIFTVLAFMIWFNIWIGRH